MAKRSQGYRIEALEPRILLSADPVLLASGVSAVTVQHLSTSTTLITVNGTSFERTGVDLLLQGSDSNDIVTIAWLDGVEGATRADFNLTVDGLGGTDAVTLLGAPSGVTWALNALTVRAESILVDDGAQVEAIDSIRLEARAEGSTATALSAHVDIKGALKTRLGTIEIEASALGSGGAAPAAFVHSAKVTVDAEIAAGVLDDRRDVLITARSQAEVATVSPDDIVVSGAQSAEIDLTSRARVSGAAVTLAATADISLSARVAPVGLTGVLDIHLDLDALVRVKAGAVVTAEDDVTMSSAVTTGVDARIDPPALSVSGVLGLDAFRANVEITRLAEVNLGETPAVVSRNLAGEDYSDTSLWAAVALPSFTHGSADGVTDLQVGDVVRVDAGHGAGGVAGQTYVFLGGAQPALIRTPGDVTLSSTVSDRQGGTPGAGVRVEVESNLFGLGTLSVDDSVRILGRNTAFEVGRLAASAVSDNSHLVIAQFAQTDAKGVTAADFGALWAKGLTAGATPRVGISASDAAAFRSRSLGLDLNDLTGTVDLIDIEAVGAINTIDRRVAAQIRGGVLQAAVSVTATAAQVVEATVSAHAVTNSFGVLRVPKFSLGGSFAINHIVGGVTARVDGVSVQAAGSPAQVAVTVQAVNDIRVNARVEAGSRAVGGSGATAAAVVALNVLGYATAPTDLAPAAHTSTATAATLAVGDVVKVGSALYRFVGASGETNVDLTTETYTDTTRWARMYRPAVGDFLLLDPAASPGLGFGAEAVLMNSAIATDGAVSVIARQNGLLNATLTNAAVTEASALFGAVGMSAGAVIASNAVQAAARAASDRNRLQGLTGTLPSAGDIRIEATDSQAIYSNVKLVSSSTTSNDGGAGLFNEVQRRLRADHTSTETAEMLRFGDLVFVTSGHTAGGTVGGLYRYLGQDAASVDLRLTDFSDLDRWKADDLAVLSPGNLTGSDAIAVGGAVVFNRVAGGAAAILTQTEITSATLTVQAVSDALISAELDSFAQSSGGSALGAGVSLAVNGSIATN
ncbi:MAG: LEPR-XLL domain-containing protein, partial [Gemmobacter sp.]|nr:LEPR-XLL domain-containing protein [Gemmobacter sp.]